MMTNILGSIVITLVTNTVEIVEPSNVNDIVFATGSSWQFERKPEIGRKKYITTTCKEITTLKLDWNGPKELTIEKVLWQSNQIYQLDWVLKQ